MLSTQFHDLRRAALSPNLFPIDLMDETVIRDKMNEIHGNINLKVYRIHFAPEQSVYEKLQLEFFSSLDAYETWFDTHAYILEGSSGPTLCDIQLFSTLVRLPLVYATLFRVSYKALNESTYPNLCLFVKRMYDNLPNIQAVVEIRGILTNYYTSFALTTKDGKKTVPMAPVCLIERNESNGPPLRE